MTLGERINVSEHIEGRESIERTWPAGPPEAKWLLRLAHRGG